MWVAKWNEVVFTDESRICLQHHDGRIRVWRHRGERMLNSCVTHRLTGPAPGILVHEQMSRFGGLSEERPSVFKTPSKLGTHLSTQCSGDERQSRPCAAR
ncbi:uncharacterized protein TNCV_3329371 [Trichonephila clavipes]|nr:uncharacterized protein TNCV_3329371 [Trichonephila clavipes]